jgi:cellulose synthase/poly-beta-1,6-N-acetylglucosamine synthase-like glycosyltransferase
MTELVRLVYAGGVIGVPLIYVMWHAHRQGRYGRLLAVAGAAGVVLLLPGPSLPLIWLALFAVMAVGLSVFVTFNGLSVYLMSGSRRAPEPPRASDAAPTISVLIPAKDEARVIAGCLDAIVQSSYPLDRLTVVVIDDGSTDRTADIARAYQVEHDNIHVVVRSAAAERGKAAALNEIIATTGSELTCILDADHHVATTFFSRTVAHFGDPRVGGVQARIAGRNWSANVLTRLVAVELLGWQYSFLDPKSQFQLVPVSFGSGCIFRTDLLQRLGGFNNALATEDLEFSFRVYEAGYRITFDPAASTSDELVSDYRSFFRQRYRWARGTTQAVRLHWLSFLTTGRATRRQKLDFFFYPFLLCMMIVPYLQIVTHAMATVSKVDLPLTYVTPLCYGAVTVLSYLVAGLRIRRDGAAMASRGLLDLVLLNIGMCVYYCALFFPANIKAFIDEFVLAMPYQRTKTTHGGAGRPRIPWLAARRFLRPSPEEQVLLTFGRQSDAADRPDRSAVHGVDWARVEQLARFHGVAGLVHKNLARYALDDAVRPDVRQAMLEFRRAILARNLLLQHAWREIAQALGREEIETIPLKGIHLLERVYPLDVRPLHDIDFLVKPLRVEETSRVLLALGYQELPGRTVAGTAWRTQRAFRSPATGVALDLHWDLINMSAYNRIYTLAIADLWQRARPSAGNPFVYEMAPEDLVLQNALHSAIHHGFTTLSQLVDLAEVVRASAPALDWERVVALAASSRIKTPVYFALTLSREMGATAVPDSVLRALEPPLYRRLWFHGYLLGQRLRLDRRGWGNGKLVWGRELKWAGLASVILADGFGDSLRVIAATLTVLVSTTSRALSSHQQAGPAQRNA